MGSRAACLSLVFQSTRDELTKNDSGPGSVQAWTIPILGEGTGRGRLHVPRGSTERRVLSCRSDVRSGLRLPHHQRILSEPGRKIQGRGPTMGLLGPIESLTSKDVQSLEEQNCSSML